jgi:repressor LexA
MARSTWAINKKQIELLLAISEYIDSNGFSPSIRDLQELVRYSSTSTIHRYLYMLEDAEYIQRKELTSRAIMITDKGKLTIKSIRSNF